MTPSLPIVLCAGALLAATGLAGCSADETRERPSVVLVLVDQLRADAAERWLSETRALAERGVRFEEMRAVAPWTYPSVISLFSGLYPQQHGADGNQDGGLLSTFDEAVPLLPRTLGRAGYHTAGFVTNPFLHEWNPVHRAFEHYDASFINNQGPTRGHGKLVWTERMYADTVNVAVRAHFDGRPRTAPEFTYVHYIDVHGRAEGPERWQGAPFESSYESAVRFVDGKIRELYDYFSARYGGELLFLVTSDHGQDLEDDLELGEGKGWRKRKASLHDFNLRIPLYVLPGRAVPAGAVVEEACANIDVVPTLLEWLGLPPQAGAPGRSLLGALRGEPYDGGARALYARNTAFGRFEEALVHARQKLVRFRQLDSRGPLPRPERAVFDLESDPREARPLRRASTEEERLLDEVAAPRDQVYPARFELPDPGTLDGLRELGYSGEDADEEEVANDAPGSGG